MSVLVSAIFNIGPGGRGVDTCTRILRRLLYFANTGIKRSRFSYSSTSYLFAAQATQALQDYFPSTEIAGCRGYRISTFLQARVGPRPRLARDILMSDAALAERMSTSGSGSAPAGDDACPHVRYFPHNVSKDT